MKAIYLSALFFIVSAADFGIAAEPEKISDTELRAAYCFAVVGAQWQHPNWIEHAAIGKSLIERHYRFGDYLFSKGFLRGHDPAGLSTAMRRGAADENQCYNELGGGEYKMCRDRCNAGITNEPSFEMAQKALQCGFGCPSPQSCGRIGRCSEEFLPFD